MLVTAIENFIANILNTMYAGMPAWNLSIGGGPSDGNLNGGTDNNVVYTIVSYILTLDKFFPIHDGFVTWVSVWGCVGAGFLVYRIVMLIINVVRGSGAR